MHDDTHCPYCGAGIEICHDDGQGYAEGELHEQECPKCDKYFVFTTMIHFTYDARKADCLNDGEHSFERTKTFPVEYTKLECTQCGEQRPLVHNNI